MAGRNFPLDLYFDIDLVISVTETGLHLDIYYLDKPGCIVLGVKYCLPELIKITLNMLMNDPPLLLSPLLFISRDNPAQSQ